MATRIDILPDSLSFSHDDGPSCDYFVLPDGERLHLSVPEERERALEILRGLGYECVDELTKEPN